MPVLWLRFAEDSSLPPLLDEAGQKQLEEIFDAVAPQSLWRRAVRAIGLRDEAAAEGLLRWHGQAPYINWSAMVGMVSGGGLSVVPKDKGFAYRESYRPKALLGLTKAQWRISRYVHEHGVADLPLPDDNNAKLVESLALGFCVLALTMRIPGKNSTLLHEGLADPEALPPAFRIVVKQIKAVQRRRNLLSPAWAVLFQHNAPAAAPDHYPAYFWDEPPAVAVSAPAMIEEPQGDSWRGIPVAGRAVGGRALLVLGEADLAAAKVSVERYILVFPLARPETVELFPYAAAVLYGEGGALCHACSVAREQNLTCMTGLGQGFIARLRAAKTEQVVLALAVDPATRSVALARPAA